MQKSGLSFFTIQNWGIWAEDDIRSDSIRDLPIADGPISRREADQQAAVKRAKNGLNYPVRLMMC